MPILYAVERRVRMKKRNSSKSGIKQRRRKSDTVVDQPHSSEVEILAAFQTSPPILRSEEQLIAKVNSTAFMPVELHSEATSYTSLELEDDRPTDSSLEITAIAHADEWGEDGAVTTDKSAKLADDRVGSEHIRPGSIFTKHLGFTPVRALTERSPSLQFGTTSFTFDHLDQRELDIHVLFTNSYEQPDYSFVCTPNLSGTSAVILEQYYDGVVVRVRREPQGLFDSADALPVNGALTWIAVG